IKTRSSEESIACVLSVIKTAQEKNIPYFLVGSPEDLHCGSWVKREGNRGFPQKAPGGPLHDFLTGNPTGMLIIDYTTFKDAEIRRATNSLLDNTRKIGDFAVPEGVKVMGIYNVADTKHSQGEDFYSRFDKRIAYRANSQEILHPITMIE